MQHWREFFSHPDYVRFVSEIVDDDRTRIEVQGLCRLLELGAGTRVLDLGCGQGRISLPLARMGCLVTGVDACGPLLERARESATTAGLNVDWIHADMKDIQLEGAFDVVINLSTAFGYVEDEADDLAALQAAHRALVAGGTLVIDTENRERTIRTALRPWFHMAGTVVWSDRSFDPLSGRWRETIKWLDQSEIKGAGFSLRLYTLSELRALLSAAGFVISEVSGDFSGAAYDLDSPRMIVLARKPADSP